MIKKWPESGQKVAKKKRQKRDLESGENAQNGKKKQPKNVNKRSIHGQKTVKKRPKNDQIVA